MASQAEVDLIISTADALPELERDLAAIIRTAEDGAETLDVEAAVAVGESLGRINRELGRIVTAAQEGASDIELNAAVDRQLSFAVMQDEIAALIEAVESDAPPVDLRAELDRIGTFAEIEPELRALVRDLEATAPEIEIEVEIDRSGVAQKSASNLGKVFKTLGKTLAAIPATMGAVSLAAGSLTSVLAGVAAAVEAIAPAAAIAVSGLLAVQLASGTVKLAMVGVKDAIKDAFDPDVKPEDLAKSMERLAPSARAFVLELRSMRSGFKEVQQEVQENFFKNFDQAARNLSTSVLPLVSDALRTTSKIFNRMALDVQDSAVALAQNGTLGKALNDAVSGLGNLAEIPGKATTALGQLAAAAGPSFDRVTGAATESATKISEKLAKAFESGALESAISKAVDAIAQLGRIAGNVFGGLGNIIKTVTVDGGGLFSVLEKVTAAFEKVTASKGFQDALRALSQTAGVLVDTILPLISTALQALGPVFQALAAPVQILVRSLGEGLNKVITALSPVLVALAGAFGQLVLLVTPFIDLAAKLLVAILPALVPLFTALGQAFNAMIPFVEQLVKNIADQLLPVFTKLATEVLPQIIPPFLELSTRIFPILTAILVALAPSLAKLGEAFGELLVAVTPLIVQLAELTIQLVDKLMPILQPLIELFLKLVSGALALVVAHITNILVPALGVLVNLLKGDFSAAWQGARDIVENVNNKIKEVVAAMVVRVGQLFLELGTAIADRVRKLSDDTVRKFNELKDRAGDAFRALPDVVKQALGDTGTVLLSAGADIVQGLINGILGKLGALRDAASRIASAVTGPVKDLLGINSPSTVMREEGNDTMDGYLLGIADRIPELRRELQGVASLAPSFALPNGQTLQLPQFNASAPTVQVFIGNEQLNGHVDTRIVRANQDRDRLMTQGVRR